MIRIQCIYSSPVESNAPDVDPHEPLICATDPLIANMLVAGATVPWRSFGCLWESL